MCVCTSTSWTCEHHFPHGAAHYSCKGLVVFYEIKSSDKVQNFSFMNFCSQSKCSHSYRVTDCACMCGYEGVVGGMFLYVTFTSPESVMDR